MASSIYNIAAPPVFNGNNYPMWAMKMKANLKAFDLWEVVEVRGGPPTRQANPTIAQMKQHNEEVAKWFKVLSCIHSAVTDAIFERIMACESVKKAWDKIKEEFHGIDCEIPSIIKSLLFLKVLSLDDNNFTGRLPTLQPSLRGLSVLHNNLIGEIPSSVCNMSSLQYFLDLSRNNFHGIIPECLGNLSNSIEMVDLSMNSFHGKIPGNFHKDCLLRSFRINDNKIEGSLPRSLVNSRN
ncbi:protein of unknown function DUF4219 - like 10 [Theobroma cacao]|nr:protein of unknown function DUF4219 - like 10 [Theobroma cacao]